MQPSLTGCRAVSDVGMRAAAGIGRCLALWIALLTAPCFAAPTIPVQTSAVPGLTTTATLSQAATLTIAYDSGNETLYAIAEATGGGFIFGSVDPISGKFSQIPSGGSPFKGSLAASITLSIDEIDNRLLILRNDGILSASLNSTAQNLDPLPTGTEAMGYDSQARQLIDRISTGVDSVNLTTGRELPVAPYAFGGGYLTLASAVDPLHHVFYLTGAGSSGCVLDAINEATGNVATIPLSGQCLIGLAFDSATKSLYGVTECCNADEPDNLLVSIATNGAETTISTVGTPSNEFPGPLPSSIDEDDRFFATSGTDTLVTADIAANRSWYIDLFPNEPASQQVAWMKQAGAALALRDAQVPGGNVSRAILDFGTPVWRDTNGTMFVGATGYSSTFISNAQIVDDVVNYARAYNAALGGNTAQLNLIVGTNNAGDSIASSSTSHGGYYLGQQWAKMVHEIQSEIASTPGLTAKIAVYGGIDIEPSYNSFQVTNNWTRGYASVIPASGSQPETGYVDFGSLDGCPSGCAKNWTADQLRTAAGNYILPELYVAGTSSLAKNWVSEMKGTSYLIAPVTQLAVCDQLSAEGKSAVCETITNGVITAYWNNAPSSAWLSLTAAMGSGANVAPSTDFEYMTVGGSSLGLPRVPASELGIRHEADFPGLAGRFSAWEGYLNNTLYRVLVGNAQRMPDDGLVIVQWGGANGFEFYRLPHSGVLRLVGEDAGAVTVLGSDGKPRRFDLLSRTLQ